MELSAMFFFTLDDFHRVWINLEQAPRLVAMERWFYYHGSFLYGLD